MLIVNFLLVNLALSTAKPIIRSEVRTNKQKRSQSAKASNTSKYSKKTKLRI